MTESELRRWAANEGVPEYLIDPLVWIMAEAVRKAVAAEKERALSLSQARFAANAMHTATWEWEKIKAAKEAERQRCAALCHQQAAGFEQQAMICQKMGAADGGMSESYKAFGAARCGVLIEEHTEEAGES